MPWSYVREVPMVKCGDLGDAQSFCDGNHGGVGGSEREVVVRVDQVDDATHVIGYELDQCQVPLGDRL